MSARGGKRGRARGLSDVAWERVPLPAVQPALELGKRGPAAGAIVLAIGNRPGAGPAAYARVPALVQGIEGHFIYLHVGPNIALRPVRQRTDLHQAELAVPFDDTGLRSVRCLVASD